MHISLRILRNVLTPTLHKCDIVFVCSLPWYDVQGPKGYGYLHEQVQKINGTSKQAQASQDPKIQEEIHR